MLFTTVLKDNKDFQRCYRNGRYCVSPIATAYFYPNDSPYNRIGITVSKKLGCAVERNRIKRIIRAAYRINEEKIPIGYDIVFVGRNNIKEKSSADIDIFINKRLVKDMNKYFEDFNKKNYKGYGKKK